MSKQFVHLHVHSHYSFLDGVCSPEQLVYTAHALGMPAIALTDHGNMFGSFKYYDACVKYGFIPIPGCEFYLCDDVHRKESRATTHITVLAMNSMGWRNLISLSTASFMPDVFYYKPRIDLSMLKEKNKGLVVLSGCMIGKVQQFLREGNRKAASRFYDEVAEVFAGRWYLEFMPLTIPAVMGINKRLVEFAQKKNAPVVITNDVHYATQDQAHLHETLMLAQTDGRLQTHCLDFWLKTRREMSETLRTLYHTFDQGFLTEAMDRTVEIASKAKGPGIDTSRKYPEVRVG